MLFGGLGLLVTVVALATSGGGGGELSFPSNSWQSAPPSQGVSSGMPQAPASMLVTVQLVGEVKEPGVYQLPADSRIFDAVALAGGFSKKADQASVNLARLLIDGEQIRVSAIGASDSNSDVAGGGDVSALININRASESELDSLPGIGPTLAGRIVDFRTANGSFTRPDQLGKVAGIGKKLLATLLPLITL